MLEALFEFFAAVLKALADLLWHSFSARSPWWWIPPVLVSALFLVLAWAFRANDNPFVPAALVALAILPLGARALLMRRGEVRKSG